MTRYCNRPSNKVKARRAVRCDNKKRHAPLMMTLFDEFGNIWLILESVTHGQTPLDVFYVFLFQHSFFLPTTIAAVEKVSLVPAVHRFLPPPSFHHLNLLLSSSFNRDETLGIRFLGCDSDIRSSRHSRFETCAQKSPRRTRRSHSSQWLG
jgi:hypothetical protein